MTTTIAATANATNSTITHYRCTECGRSGVSTFRGGQISHRRDCDSNAQPWQIAAETVAAPVAVATEPDKAIRAFASDVRRTGLTKGRDNDVFEAVRKGYLSMDAAMNTDD